MLKFQGMKKLTELFNFRLNKYLFLIIFTNLLLYLISFLFVRNYYTSGLPYYDSVGSYVNMFSIANKTRQTGILSGILAARYYSLSWLQSFFAVFAANLLPNAPEWMILLNFLTLFVAQWAIFRYVQNIGLGNKKAYILSFLPLLPGVAFGWAGGVIDMRRDSSFLMMLIAGFFFFIDFMRKPRIKKGVVVGIVWGITLWSRGNALPYLLGVLGPIFFLNILRNIQKKTMSAFIKHISIPILVCLLISTPFYWLNWKGIYDKYVFGSWGIGVDRLSAIITFLRFLPVMILGPEQNVLWVNTLFLLVMLSFILFLLKKKIVLIAKHWYGESNAKDLLASGILIYLLVLIFNAIILGVGGYIFPNFPALVGIIAVVIYFVGGLKMNKNVNKTFISLGLAFWTIIIILLNSLRMYVSIPPDQKILVQQVKQAATDLAPILGGKQVAYFWLDHIHVHDLNFYITQNGGVPIQAGSGLSSIADTEMPPNPKKTIDEQQVAYTKGVRNREYVIVSEDLKSYEDPKGFFFILMYGKPVVEEILKDANLKKIYSFSDGVRNYVVLKNLKYENKHGKI